MTACGVACGPATVGAATSARTFVLDPEREFRFDSRPMRRAPPHSPSAGRFASRAIVAALACVCLAACSDPIAVEPPGPDPIITQAALEAGGFIEVSPCRPSHEHDLRHVRVVANLAAADRYRRCVLTARPDDPLCQEPFPEGALFVKYEYELPGCVPAELVSYTANAKLAKGAFESGRDWRWQRISPKFKVEEDGAPWRCLLCHIDHCEPPYGHDLRCTPD